MFWFGRDPRRKGSAEPALRGSESLVRQVEVGDKKSRGKEHVPARPRVCISRARAREKEQQEEEAWVRLGKEARCLFKSSGGGTGGRALASESDSLQEEKLGTFLFGVCGGAAQSSPLKLEPAIQQPRGRAFPVFFNSKVSLAF